MKYASTEGVQLFIKRKQQKIMYGLLGEMDKTITYIVR